MLLYPLFVYSWIPITFVGFWHRNDREWSHTEHTRGLSYDEMIMGQDNFPKHSDLLSKQGVK
jgi:hypothetical protein